MSTIPPIPPAPATLDQRLRKLCVRMKIDADSRLHEGHPGIPVQFDPITEIERAVDSLNGAVISWKSECNAMRQRAEYADDMWRRAADNARAAEGRLTAIREALGIQPPPDPPSYKMHQNTYAQPLPKMKIDGFPDRDALLNALRVAIDHAEHFANACQYWKQGATEPQRQAALVQIGNAQARWHMQHQSLKDACGWTPAGPGERG